MQAVFFEQALLPSGWARDVRVSWAAGRITGIAPDAAPVPGEVRHATGLPGLPNLHSHGFQRGMAGLAETRGPHIQNPGADSFWTWRELMYRFLDRLTPDDVAAISALAFVEMVESGFTRVGEFHYLHHDPAGRRYADPAELCGQIAAAAAEAGIRLSLLPVFYAQGGFGGAAPAPAQRRFICDLDGFARLLAAARRLPGVAVGVAPHSLRAVTPEQLAEVCALAGDAPLHIHVAEQLREVEDCLAWSGARPVEWLLDHAAVGPRWCLIHATHVSQGELARLAASGATVGLCPVTEANLGDGIFPADAFRRAGGRYGVGTDSNVAVGAAQELRQLEYAQRLALRARNVMASTLFGSTGRALFEAALAGGAAALGVPASGLAVGAPADLVALAPGPGRDDRALDAWIFADGAVASVWIGGAQLVSDGRHHARARVAARADRVRRRLLA